MCVCVCACAFFFCHTSLVSSQCGPDIHGGFANVTVCFPLLYPVKNSYSFIYLFYLEAVIVCRSDSPWDIDLKFSTSAGLRRVSVFAGLRPVSVFDASGWSFANLLQSEVRVQSAFWERSCLFACVFVHFCICHHGQSGWRHFCQQPFYPPTESKSSHGFALSTIYCHPIFLIVIAAIAVCITDTAQSETTNVL